jgi:hypothetical protein
VIFLSFVLFLILLPFFFIFIFLIFTISSFLHHSFFICLLFFLHLIFSFHFFFFISGSGPLQRLRLESVLDVRRPLCAPVGRARLNGRMHAMMHARNKPTLHCRRQFIPALFHFARGGACSPSITFLHAHKFALLCARSMHHSIFPFLPLVLAHHQ